MLDFNHDYPQLNICSFCRVRDRTGDEEAVTLASGVNQSDLHGAVLYLYAS